MSGQRPTPPATSSAQPGGVSGWTQRLFAAVVGLLVLLALVEAGLRLGCVGFQALQDQRNRAALAEEGAYRILCLGDSMTAGQYPIPLRWELAERAPGLDFAVLEQARPMLSSGELAGELEGSLAAIGPHMVVVMIGANDGPDRMPYGGLPVAERAPLRSLRLVRLLVYHLQGREPHGPHRSGAGGEGAQRGSEQDPLLQDEAFRVETNRGWNLFYQGDLEAAEASFRSTLERFPGLGRRAATDPAGGLVACGIAGGDAAVAEARLRDLLEESPDIAWAWAALARLYEDRGSQVQAIQAWEESAQRGMGGRAADVELLRALALRAQIQRRAAIHHPGIALEDLAETDDYRHAFEQLEWLLERAERELERALAELPQEPVLHDTMARCLEARGRLEEAGLHRETAAVLRRETFNPVTRDNLLWVGQRVQASGAKLVVMAYPRRSVEPLQRMLEPLAGVIYVEHREPFERVLAEEPLEALFVDMHGGDYGHCTPRGNELVAGTLADAVLEHLAHGP